MRLDDGFVVPGWATAQDWETWATVLGALATVAAVLVAGGALWIAHRQLEGLIQSNKELARSNDEMSLSNLARTRPFVLVDYELRRHSFRNPNGDVRATLLVTITNVGQTPARDLTLVTDSPFRSANTANVSAEAISKLNDLFSGKQPVRLLSPGRPLRYVLDNARDAMESEQLPETYNVTANYWDMSGENEFTETYPLELSAWKISVADEDPMRRLSKDMQAANENLKRVAKGIEGVKREISDLADALNGAAPSEDEEEVK